MGQSWPLFRHFHITIQLQIEKSIDGVLGIRTRGHTMVGTEETTELWRPPYPFLELKSKDFMVESCEGIFVLNL